MRRRLPGGAAAGAARWTVGTRAWRMMGGPGHRRRRECGGRIPGRGWLLARSRHASMRSLERYARPGPEALARHVAAADLHTSVQTAFGWGGEHLHRFVIHGAEYGINYVGGPVSATPGRSGWAGWGAVLL